MEELKTAIQATCKKLFGANVQPELSRPDEQFGDFATNVALQLAQEQAKEPRGIAEAIARELKELPMLSDVQVAGPGFINLTLTDETLGEAALSATDLPRPLADQEILVEFGDPNPFKEMHIGHLYQYIVGDAIASLLEANGAKVKRLSYHGDVGLHVARAIYGLRELEKERQARDKTSSDVPTIEKEDFLGVAYAYGAQKYEESKSAKTEIEQINLHVYKQDDPAINRLHEEGIELSFSYFDQILGLLNIRNDKRYLESQTSEIGKDLVEKNLGKVFKESQGAIIYEGEKVDLHTRVFITSKGLPTYDTKDLGLVMLKNRDYPGAARSIVITGNEQSEYFKVMLAALTEIDRPLADKTTHLSSGFVSLSSGKMSSRSGNVYAAMKLLLEVKDAVHEQYPDSDVKKEVTFGSVKYDFLKHRLGPDIVFDIEESISLEGNSGPYLQYAHARASSILAKAGTKSSEAVSNLEAGERSLALKISEYPEVIAKATNEFMPHHICTYLYEMSQSFNRFYEQNRVIDNERQDLRLRLVKAYAEVLKHGLDLLGISTPEHM